MPSAHRLRHTTAWAGGAVAAAGACYLASAGWSWLRYGAPAPPAAAEADQLLDAFMPVYDIVERHHVAVDADAATTVDAARHIDAEGTLVSRAIFRARELLLGSAPVDGDRPESLEAFARSIGWEVLAEVPGREVVFGAVTKPWEADVTFRGVAAPFFAGFDEPDYVKIVWTLRADPDGSGRAVFRTETRAVATSVEAREKFRRYWALLSPGIRVIRWSLLWSVQRAANARAQACACPAASA